MAEGPPVTSLQALRERGVPSLAALVEALVSTLPRCVVDSPRILARSTTQSASGHHGPHRPCRVRAVALGLIALALVAAGCGSGGRSDDAATAQPAPTFDLVPAPAVPASTDPTDGDPFASVATDATDPAAPPIVDTAPVDVAGSVEQVVAAMTIEQKVGQLFTAVVMGDDAVSVSDAAASANQTLYGVATPAEIVARYHLGGVAYFDHQQGEGTSNVSDLSRTATLSLGLQQAAANDSGIGLLIGTDQEGGPVVRLRAPATVFPAARDIAATGSLELAEQVGAVTGTESLALGVNWVYAPVADVNVNPANPVIGERAFGTTAAETIPWVLATARGLTGSGVLPTLKHFPGHGDTAIDSHTSLPTIDHDAATLAAVDFPPFLEGTVGLDPISVMVGHLAVPSVDPSGLPATLSAPIIDLIRADPAAGGLGFDGLVVTDAMNMGALSELGDAGSLAVGAIAAGIDMVLMPTDLPLAYAAVLAAAQDGTLTMARIDQAVTRVLRAKASIGVLDAAAIAPGDPSLVGAPAHAAVLAQVRDACAC